MAQHDIGLKVSETLWLTGRDVQIPVWVDGVERGRILISKGAIDWVPYNKTPTQGHSRTWKAFIKFMEDSKRKPRGAKRAKKRRT
jgi:hypothetical protein